MAKATHGRCTNRMHLWETAGGSEGYVDGELRGKGPSRQRHYQAAEGREDRRRRRQAYVKKGNGPSWRIHQLAALVGDGRVRRGRCLVREALQGP